MFKKKIAIFVAAALMTLSTSSAFAAFGDLELIRVYYDRTTDTEILTDLGKVNDLTTLGTTTAIAGSFTGMAAASSYVVYFAVDQTTNQLWVSGSTTTASVINGTSGGMTTLKSGVSAMYASLNTQGGTTYSTTNNSLDYKNKLSQTQGFMSNAINAATRLNTEASLTSLITNGTGSVSQTLYFWNNGLTTVAADKIGMNAASIVTNANGTTVITGNSPVATPIPAAFYLMGSGLMGLVGLRRRNKA